VTAAARRALGLALALLCYAAAVSSPWQAASSRADARGCVLPHALQAQTVVFAGLLGGLALGALLVGSARALLRALLPQADERRRGAALVAAAGAELLISMASSVLWVRPGFDRFLDHHRPLLVETDLLLFLTGLADGAAWSALLDREGWLGLLIAPAMALMLISSGVVGRGWC